MWRPGGQVRPPATGKGAPGKGFAGKGAGSFAGRPPMAGKGTPAMAAKPAYGAAAGRGPGAGGFGAQRPQVVARTAPTSGARPGYQAAAPAAGRGSYGASAARPYSPAGAARAPQGVAAAQKRLAPQAPASAPPQKLLRTAAPSSAPAASTSSINSSTNYRVTCTKERQEELETLVGDYVEKGSNHGRKFYKKVQKIAGGPPGASAFLYFWDDRDGPEFHGWWFGEKVGGSEVWAKVSGTSTTPPKSGWRIPWDGPPCRDLMVEPSNSAGAGGAQGGAKGAGKAASSVGGAQSPTGKGTGKVAAAAASVSSAETNKKVEQAQSDVDARIQEAADVLTTAEALSGEEADETALTEAEGLLKPHIAENSALQKKLSADIMAVRGQPKAMQTLQDLLKQLKTSFVSLSKTGNQIRQRLAKAKSEAASRQKEEQDEEAFKTNFDAANEAVTEAEAAVEKAAAAKGKIGDSGDPEALEEAFKETEKLAQEGQTLITKARGKIQVLSTGARSYGAKVKSEADQEIKELEKKLSEQQKLLIPLKRAKQDYEERKANEETLAKVTDDMASAEVEIEKIEEKLKALEATPEQDANEVSEAVAAVEPVKASLAKLMNLILSKSRALKGSAQEDMTSMKERCKTIQAKLEEVRVALMGIRDQNAIKSCVTQGSEKLTKLEEIVENCGTAELPFLKGLEVLPVEESIDALAQADELIPQADEALKDALQFVRTTLQQVKQGVTLAKRESSKEACKKAQEELQELLKKMTEIEKRVATFKKDTDQRKIANLAQEVATKVEEMQKKVEAVVVAAAAISAGQELPGGIPSDTEAKAFCESVRTLIASRKPLVKGPDAESITEDLAKAQKEVAKGMNSLSKSKQSLDALRSAKLALVSDALRVTMRSSGKSAASLFEEAAEPKAKEMTRAQFSSMLTSILKGEHEMSSLHRDLVLQQLLKGPGDGKISRHEFLKFVERYYECCKDISITPELDIGKGKQIRKLAVGELLEVVEGPKTLDDNGMIRVKCKALIDGVSGWATVKGNAGTPFLKEVAKPVYCVAEDTPMLAAFDSPEGSEPIRVVKPNEAFEPVEGPKSEKSEEQLRLRGKATKDGQTGWITLKMGTKENATVDKSYHTCHTAVAITDGQDITKCKSLRKLAAKEVLKVLEGPLKDENSGVQRVRAKCVTDGVEGWVTVTGNAGTKFLVESDKHYVVKNGVSLQSTRKLEGATLVRELEPDEVFEGLLEPCVEVPQVLKKLKCRILSDGQVGVIAVSNQLKAYSPFYKCAKSTPILDQLEIDGAKTIRRLEQEESVECVDGPVKDSKGLLRMKGVAEKDGVEGWITISGNQGTPFLIPA